MHPGRMIFASARSYKIEKRVKSAYDLSSNLSTLTAFFLTEKTWEKSLRQNLFANAKSLTKNSALTNVLEKSFIKNASGKACLTIG